MNTETASAGVVARTRVVPRIYRGQRGVDGRCTVTVEIDEFVRELNPRNDLVNHSPTGFDWGYAGSGPSQLSLALLADALRDDERAANLYQRFKWVWTYRLVRDQAWEISDVRIRELVASIEHVAAARVGGL